MSESKNTNVEKDGTVNNEKKETGKVVKLPEDSLRKEPSKSDRLDRMEKQLNLIEKGILVLINSTQWANLSITPVGTHNPDFLIDGYMSIQDAMDELAPDENEQVSQ